MRNGQGRITNFVSVLNDITERRRREEQDIELRLAAAIQQRLYPVAPPIVEGFDLAAATAPAGPMNGDYYDFVTLPDGAIAIAIGDVSGHGLGQALDHGADPSLSAVDGPRARRPGADPDRARQARGAGSRARTFHLAAPRGDRSEDTGDPIRQRRARARLRPRCVWGDQDGARRSWPAAGPPGEANPLRTVAASSPVLLEPGDVLALFTDGIAEAESPGGVPFGAGRARGVIVAHGQATAGAIVEGLSTAIRSFLGGTAQRDDVTMVICKCDMNPAVPSAGLNRHASPAISATATHRTVAPWVRRATRSHPLTTDGPRTRAPAVLERSIRGHARHPRAVRDRPQSSRGVSGLRGRLTPACDRGVCPSPPRQ